MIDNWRPTGAANSIDMVALVLSFGQPIPDILLQRVLLAQEQTARKLGFNDIQPIQGFHFSFGGAAPSPVPVTGKLMSVSEPNPDPYKQNFTEQIQFDANNFVYRLGKYRSWSDTLARYLEVVGGTLSALSQVIAPTTIRLEYLDRFFLSPDAASASVKTLLRQNSKYISPYIFDESSMWHSHTGALTAGENGRGKLLQVNIDSVDLSDGLSVARSLQIMSAREDRFPVDSIELDRGAPDMVATTLTQMHSDLIGVYRELISDETAAAVGLA